MILKSILYKDGMVYVTVAPNAESEYTEKMRISGAGWKLYGEKYSAVEGCEVGETEYDILHELSERTEAVLSAARTLSSGDKSERELYSKLCRNYSAKAAGYAVRLMKKRGYINEAEQCRRYAEDAVRTKHRGAARIKSELISRGYDAKEAREAVLSIPDEDYAAALNICIERKFPRIGEMDSAETKKAVASLMRLGFSADEIFGEIKKRR